MPTTALSMFALAAAAVTTGAFADEAGLSKRVTQQDGWSAYSVTMTADAGSACCYDSRDHVTTRKGCDLEGHSWSVSNHLPGGADDTLTIYLHASQGRIEKVRAFSASCPVKEADQVRRIDGVNSADSIALLARFATDHSAGRDAADTAVAALAMHADAAATPALNRLADPSRTRALREQALFWLAQARGADGAHIVEGVIASDHDDELRANAVFDLSQARGVDAYATIHRISRQDASEHVREQALFWMAQMNDARAKADITAAISEDKSDRVREQGVFALSQLKEGQASAALIAVVRGNYPRKVKQQALFWLGESGTDEAMNFLDEVLSRRPERHAGS